MEEQNKLKSYSAGHLYSIAKSAYKRTQDSNDPSDRKPGKSDAIVAIIFSAASIEAFINELADMAAEKTFLSVYPQSVLTYGTIMEEIEESKGSVRLKYLVTRAIFANDTYDKGVSPYQDFVRLFKLRDSLIHLKPKDEFATTPNIVRISTPQVIKDLPAHLLADQGENTVSSWIGMISTQAMARWACLTASNMISSVISILPESAFRQMVIIPFGDIFTLPI